MFPVNQYAGFHARPPLTLPKTEAPVDSPTLLLCLPWNGSEASRATELEKEAFFLRQTVERVEEELRERTSVLAEADRRAMAAMEQAVELRGRLREATEKGVEKVKSRISVSGLLA